MKVSNVVKIIIVVVVILLIVGVICFFSNKNNKEYSLEKIEDYSYYLLKQNDKFGVINKNGEILIQPQYSEIKIPNPQKAVFVCKKTDNTTVILNDKQEQILSEYDNVDTIKIEGTVSNLPYEKSVLKYEKNGKLGLISLEGKEITKPIYEEIQGLTNKESELLVKKDSKYGVINSKGATIIDNKYDNVVADGFYTEEDGYELSGYITSIKTQDGYRYGYINSKHKKILDTEYADVSRVVEIPDKEIVYLLAVKNGQVGIIQNEKVIIDYKYQDIEYHASNKTFILQRNSKYGLVDINGQTIIPVQYDSIEFNGEYISATINNQVQLFSIEGNQVNDAVYNSLIKIEDKNYYITIDKSGKYGVIDSNRIVKVDNEYQYLEYLFGSYLIASKEDGKLGIITLEGSKIVDFQYDVLQKINNTNVVEAKKLNDRTSDLYSKDIKKILSATNVTINVKDNYIQVISDNINYFDFNGTEVTSKQVLSQNELYASKKDGKWGFVDKQDKVVVDYSYDMVTEFNEYGFAGVKSGDKWGVINQKGELVQEQVYKIGSMPEFIGKYYKVYYGYGESYYTDNHDL